MWKFCEFIYFLRTNPSVLFTGPLAIWVFLVLYVWTLWVGYYHQTQLIIDEDTHARATWRSEEGGPMAWNSLSPSYAHCTLLCLFSHSHPISLTPVWNFPSKQLVNDGALSCIFKHLTGIFHCTVSALRSHKLTHMYAFWKSQQSRLAHLHLNNKREKGQ